MSASEERRVDAALAALAAEDQSEESAARTRRAMRAAQAEDDRLGRRLERGYAWILEPALVGAVCPVYLWWALSHVLG